MSIRRVIAIVGGVSPHRGRSTLKTPGYPEQSREENQLENPICVYLQQGALVLEITYNYGDSEWPWRCKIANEKEQPQPQEQQSYAANEVDSMNIAETDALLTVNPLLIEKDRMLSEQNPQVPGEGIQEGVIEKGAL
ncbi:hypothetical protein NFI96_026360 [Prochilodus magdalenae]|nr:hypothetical protein NFI96_026360 [Prochilodus magdalenae]